MIRIISPDGHLRNFAKSKFRSNHYLQAAVTSLASQLRSGLKKRAFCGGLDQVLCFQSIILPRSHSRYLMISATPRGIGLPSPLQIGPLSIAKTRCAILATFRASRSLKGASSYTIISNRQVRSDRMDSGLGPKIVPPA